MAVMTNNFFQRPGQQVTDNPFKQVGNNPYNVMTQTQASATAMRPQVGMGRNIAQQEAKVQQGQLRQQLGQQRLDRQTAITQHREDLNTAIEIARQNVEDYRNRVLYLIQEQQRQMREMVAADRKERSQYQQDTTSEGTSRGVGEIIGAAGGLVGSLVGTIRSGVQNRREKRTRQEEQDALSAKFGSPSEIAAKELMNEGAYAFTMPKVLPGAPIDYQAQAKEILAQHQSGQTPISDYDQNRLMNMMWKGTFGVEERTPDLYRNYSPNSFSNYQSQLPSAQNSINVWNQISSFLGNGRSLLSPIRPANTGFARTDISLLPEEDQHYIMQQWNAAGLR